MYYSCEYCQAELTSQLLDNTLKDHKCDHDDLLKRIKYQDERIEDLERCRSTAVGAVSDILKYVTPQMVERSQEQGNRSIFLKESHIEQLRQAIVHRNHKAGDNWYAENLSDLRIIAEAMSLWIDGRTGRINSDTIRGKLENLNEACHHAKKFEPKYDQEGRWGLKIDVPELINKIIKENKK